MKNIPKFKNEKEEREFWLEKDSADYIDWSKAKKHQYVNLKPSTKHISIRLTEGLLDNLKMIAKRDDVPYQSLIKVYLSEAVRRELS